MGCLYATSSVDKCQCQCNGSTMHGMLAEKPSPVFIKCSPSVEKRCKAGEEGGKCQCACGGHNHGLYASIPEFDQIPISGYQIA